MIMDVYLLGAIGLIVGIAALPNLIVTYLNRRNNRR